MMTAIIDILIAGILISLLIVNKIGIEKTKRRRQNICWNHNRKMILGLDARELKGEVDLIVDKNKLRMHNKGTDLQKETDRLEFNSLSNGTDLFWKKGDWR